MEKKQYDGMMVFNVPIMVVDEGVSKEPITVLGLLYSTSERKTDPVWLLSLETYSSYLLGVERLYSEGGRVIDKETWMTRDGKVHNVGTSQVLIEIYLKLRGELQYKLYEFSQPIQYEESEVKDLLILTPSILDRCGVSFIESLNIKK